MEKINILHITFNMAIGGTEQVIRQLVTHVNPERFNASIICIDGYIGAIGEQLQSSSVKIHCVNRKRGFDTKLIQRIRKILIQDGIRLIHCHQYTPYIFGLFASFGTGARVIFTEHGRFYPDTYRFKRILLNPFLSRLTPEVTAISKATKDALTRYEFFPPHKIKVVYNGILPVTIDHQKRVKLREELNIENKARIIGTVSRLDSIKNQKMMIAAFHKVQQQYPKVRLLIIGDGPIRHELEVQAKTLEIQEKVLFTGFKKNPLSYMSIMEIFLLSSFSEGTSMTLLEAMSLSLPCVVTDVGGNSEVVKDQHTGLVTPSDNMEAFANSIISLLDDPILLQSYGKAGLHRFEQHFTVEKMVLSYSALYEKNLA